MSHIIQVETVVKDREMFAKAARALGYTVVGEGVYQMYSGTVRGLAIQIPNWRYALVVDAEGSISYDNYGGRWGETKDLHELTQTYAQNEVERQMRIDGLDMLDTYTEDDGTIVLEINAGGWF